MIIQNLIINKLNYTYKMFKILIFKNWKNLFNKNKKNLESLKDKKLV